MKTLAERLTLRESVWNRMRCCKKPVVLYGMGDGAQEILQVCAARGIAVAAVFASDAFVRGQSFCGYRVERYSELCARYDDFLVVVSFATQRPEVLQNIARIAQEHETLAPDVPVVWDEPGQVFDRDYMGRHRNEIAQAYTLFADERSRATYAAVLSYKITGEIDVLRRAQSTVEEFYELLNLSAHEDYVDLGAYRGDTVEELLRHTNGEYHTITALEPDEKTYGKLCQRVQELGLAHVRCLNLAAHQEKGELHFLRGCGRGSLLCKQGGQQTRMVAADSVDNVMEGRPVSFIKMDVEGAEYETLLGCAATIARCAPKLCVAAYHRNGDLFRLPLLLHKMHPEYRLYLRHFPYIPAWDTNLCAL